MGGVVEKATHKGQVSSSNPTSHEARDVTWNDVWLVSSLGLKIFFSYF
jgi:hypothetical protein